MSKLLSSQALSWVHQSAAAGSVTSQVLDFLLQRVDALEGREFRGTRFLAAPTPIEAALAARPAPPAALAQPEVGEAWAVDALRELSEAFYDQFFGADDWLSPRLISAANEAQRLLVTQGHPVAPESPQPAPPAAPAGGLVEMVVAATWEAEELAGEEYERAAIARVAIRHVAAWLDLQGQHGCSLLLREEADR
jgi:hypothetical protein